MQYDPIKRNLGNIFNKASFLRKLFYHLLDVLLLRTWHIKREIKIWKKQISDSINILDAGSGFGQYTYYLSGINKQWKITGIDVKTEQIDDCNIFFKKINRSNVSFEVQDLLIYNEPSKYNLILSVDVMEHILEDVVVFKNFNSMLKSGGLLLISTPSDLGGSDAHDHDDHSFIEEHVRNGYNAKDIEEKLKNSGFHKIEVLYSYGKPGNISWKLSMKFPILMLGASKIFYLLLPFYYLITFPFCLILNYFDTNIKHKAGTGLIVKAYKP